MYPLWLQNNDTQNSLVFVVSPGWVASLFATGFERFAAHLNSEDFESPQLACLHRIVLRHKVKNVGLPEPGNCCSILGEIKTLDTTVFDEEVWNEHCLWSMGSCDNIKILPFPGTYYFHLNDETAVGKAQIWVDFFKSDEIPLHMMRELLP